MIKKNRTPAMNMREGDSPAMRVVTFFEHMFMDGMEGEVSV
jgi:hypothetical protein